MKQKLQVPVEGSNIRRETTYPVATENGYAVVGQKAPPILAPEAEAPATIPETPQTPQTPPRELQPLEQFHPAFINKDIRFDEKTGRLRITPKAEEVAAAAETQDEGAESELPALGEQHQAIPGGTESQQAAPSSEIQQLRAEMAQNNQLMVAMAQSMMSGRPLNEFLGLAPSQPAEPDYSEYDLYDPDQRSAFIKQIRQEARAEAQAAIAPHQQVIQSARQQQEQIIVAQQYGNDANFQNKMAAALQLVQANPAMSVENAYKIVSHIVGVAVPSQSKAVAPSQASANQATRTITPEQAQQKAEQAKRLPRDSGVRGAGPAPVPEHFGVGDLGKMIAWNLQQASR